MNTRLVAFSGKKGSGKNTCCELVEKIYRRELFSTGFVGEFIVTDGKSIPIIRSYSFAHWLKFIAVKILGLSPEQVYGTDEEKNSATQLRWENMPGINTEVFWKDVPGIKIHTPGYMSAREVLQYLGTDIFRYMYPNVWVDATIRQIQEDEPIIATISDCRFLSEVEAIENLGGKVVRLLRNSDSEDSHESERQLDSYNEWDYLIDNRELTLEELEKAVESMMKKLDII